jgi:hypothetical protein
MFNRHNGGCEMESSMRIHQVARFSLGLVTATPGAMHLLEKTVTGALPLLARHQSGDWGEIDAEDQRANEEAIEHGWRLFSSYEIAESKLWIITEADRSTTTILLPEEY